MDRTGEFNCRKLYYTDTGLQTREFWAELAENAVRREVAAQAVQAVTDGREYYVFVGQLSDSPVSTYLGKAREVRMSAFVLLLNLEDAEMGEYVFDPVGLEPAARLSRGFALDSAYEQDFYASGTLERLFKRYKFRDGMTGKVIWAWRRVA